MPVLPTTAYGSCEDVILAARAIVNDMEIPAGDVLTDSAPFTMEFVNLAYQRIQAYLAQYGVETFSDYAWLLNIPANTTGDPEARVIISDSGTEIFTPSGQDEASFDQPFLPTDLIAPLRLRERPTGSTNAAVPMHRPNDGLHFGANVCTYMRVWEWIADALKFIGASQTMDVEMKYEKAMPNLSEVTDPVPIRGVTNAAAYRVAYMFAKARGSAIADNFGAEGQQELDLLVNRSMRERQRIKVRRQPYSRRGNRGGRYH